MTFPLSLKEGLIAGLEKCIQNPTERDSRRLLSPALVAEGYDVKANVRRENYAGSQDHIIFIEQQNYSSGSGDNTPRTRSGHYVHLAMRGERSKYQNILRTQEYFVGLPGGDGGVKDKEEIAYLVELMFQEPLIRIGGGCWYTLIHPGVYNYLKLYVHEIPFTGLKADFVFMKEGTARLVRGLESCGLTVSAETVQGLPSGFGDWNLEKLRLNR